MKERAKTVEPSEDRHSYSPLGILSWLSVVVVIYALGIGPAMWMYNKNYLSQNNFFLKKFYTPLEWAYYSTVLHKPLGIYLHLWVPQRFDEHGDLI